MLTDLPAHQIDAVWYGLRSWDAAGFRQRKSMGWQRGQLVEPDAVAWQYLVVAIATLWARSPSRGAGARSPRTEGLH